MYTGESKIICNLGTCSSFGCTAGWAWRDTHGLLLSYHCGAGVTLIVHFCCEFCAISMDTPLFTCTKEEQRAVIRFFGLKVYHMLKCTEGCQCSTGTASCWNRLSTNGSRGSGMAAQALSMRKELDVHPRPLLRQTQNESMTWSCRADEWLLMKWHINCKFFMGQPMKLSTTGLPSLKSVHDGSQSNSQNCTKRNVWASANGFWIAMVLKVTIFWNESSRDMKHGSTIMSQRVNTRVWNRNILICPPKTAQKTPHCRKANAHSFLGTHKGYYRNIMKRGVQPWSVFATVRCCVTS